MKHPTKVGFSFGLTSGVITTLGLITGLYSSVHSRMVVLGGILTIALADAFSDAMGIHVSEESENKHTHKEIWEATLSTFFSKLFFALTFALPILLLPLSTAVIVSIVWGFFLLSISGFYLAKKQKTTPWKIVGEHLLIALVVLLATFYIGKMVAAFFV